MEIKRKLDGSEHRFACDALSIEPSAAILRYVIDRDWQVAGIRLSPGCVTWAVYWTDRPYNVYWWVDAGGESLGFYFNVADSVRISADVVVWRDLSLDILVDNDGNAEVLDEHELPVDLEPALRRTIEDARKAILADPAALTREIQRIVSRAVGA